MPTCNSLQLRRDAKTMQFLTVLVSLHTVSACSSNDSGGQIAGAGGAGTGGFQALPGTGGSAVSPSSGGAVSSGGAYSTGGSRAATGGTSTGGAAQTGGARPTGGASPTGGSSSNSGGTATTGSGGATLPGGGSATGGKATSTGGSSSSPGGSNATGGKMAGSGGSAPAGGANATGGSGAVAGASAAGGASDTTPSTGCGKTPTLKNSPSTANQNTLTSSGKSREFIIRWPDNYDKNHPYRLIIGLHGATGKDTDIGPSYFGLWSLSNNSTIFIAPSADGGLWSAASDTTFVDDILKAVEADLCVDTTRIMLEGFSQGAAMTWTLACSRPGVFRAVVGHSGGGVAAPSTCKPIPYFGSGGKQENVTQTTQTDQFAKWNGCTVTTLPTAPTGGHVCTSYTGCPAADPVRWCNFDGPHTPSPTDSGKSSSWMPSETWPFFSQF